MKRVQLKEQWSEAKIAKMLVESLFKSAVLAVPCCGWTGHECDLLVIDKKSLRIIDLEIKISRADFKADAKKAKWWEDRPWSRRHLPAEPRQWPAKVWKHYYVLPSSIWTDELYGSINESSGVIVIGTQQGSNKPAYGVLRAAKPCRDAKPISAVDAIDIARLAGLRMWAALAKEN